jgi:hypothetical protein
MAIDWNTWYGDSRRRHQCLTIFMLSSSYFVFPLACIIIIWIGTALCGLVIKENKSNFTIHEEFVTIICILNRDFYCLSSSNNAKSRMRTLHFLNF